MDRLGGQMAHAREVESVQDRQLKQENDTLRDRRLLVYQVAPVAAADWLDQLGSAVGQVPDLEQAAGRLSLRGQSARERASVELVARLGKRIVSPTLGARPSGMNVWRQPGW